MALGHLTVYPYVEDNDNYIVPVDYVVNSIIEISLYLLKHSKKHITIGSSDYYKDVISDNSSLPLVPIFHMNAAFLSPVINSDIPRVVESYFNISPLKKAAPNIISFKPINPKMTRGELNLYIEELSQIRDQEPNPVKKRRLLTEITILSMLYFLLTR